MSVASLLVFLVAMVLAAPSTGGETASKHAGEKLYFAGCNLLSPVPALLPVPGSTLFSVLSNLECGFGVSGGTMINRCHAVELRLALGPNSRSETIFNTQIYYNFFLMRRLNMRMKGLYLGGGMRYWDLYNGLTKVHRNNMAGQIDLGYRFRVYRPLYVDLRMSEIVAMYSWLSAEHTLGGWATLASSSLPKSPLVSIDLGIRL
jgi:hypothetical protein